MQVLNLLGCYTDKAGWCRRSQVKMAKQLKCGRSSVQRSLDNLVTAGWVEKKRPPWGSREDQQPSNSYMYRVILDRDDFDIEAILEDRESETDSYTENASDDDCPPVGSDNDHTSGHPGAQPSVGTGAQPYVGTKNDPLERPLLERERDTRARDRKARFLVSFEARWPTSAADDRQRTAYAAESLTEDEEEPALGGIAPFLEDLKRHHRKGVPAGWKYLEQKRWTLLEKKQEAGRPQVVNVGANSPEARAIIVLFEIGGITIPKHRRRADGSIDYNHAMTSQISALADAPSRDAWPALSRQQAGAWEDLLRHALTIGVRRPLREGDRAPWPWPPRKDGTHSTTGPPETLMSEADMTDFK
jgi:hypothetical protein